MPVRLILSLGVGRELQPYLILQVPYRVTVWIVINPLRQALHFPDSVALLSPLTVSPLLGKEFHIRPSPEAHSHNVIFLGNSVPCHSAKFWILLHNTLLFCLLQHLHYRLDGCSPAYKKPDIPQDRPSLC